MKPETSIAVLLLTTVHATWNEVQGTDGMDKMFGGEGFDIMYGGPGGNNLVGGPDGDTASFGDGNDNAFGAGGEDRLHGQDDDDKLYGGEGDDTFSGGNGVDTVWAGGGNDMLFGGSDTDTVDGQWDDDIVRGGDGNDIVRGDGGFDTAYLDTEDTVFVNILTTGKARKIVLSTCVDKSKEGNQIFVCPSETYAIVDDGNGTPAWTEGAQVTESYDDVCEGMVTQATLQEVQDELDCVKNGDVWNATTKTCDAPSQENCLHMEHGTLNYVKLLQNGQKFTFKDSPEQCNSACKLVAGADVWTFKYSSKKCICKKALSSFIFFPKTGRVSAYVMDTYSSTPCA